ncbi:ketoreductase [Trichophyton violaceum]|uniref:D-xylose reductase [NAD(P)H] n=1 Tax=Trichophyton violaceum TaxID=34388 RepID=A0A178FP00_TRIVO|nr:ketoreductase [Trichophyton violaceum]
MAAVPAVKLENGASVPVLGYGTGTAWYKKAGAKDIDQDTVDAVATAIGTGYRHLDSAEAYGTEKELGIAIKKSNVKREDFFITAKAEKGIGDIQDAIERTLRNLRVDYVDLYLIHEPFFAQSDEELQSKWAEMEQV